MADVLGVSADSGEAKTLPAIPSDDLVDSSSLAGTGTAAKDISLVESSAEQVGSYQDRAPSSVESQGSGGEEDIGDDKGQEAPTDTKATGNVEKSTSGIVYAHAKFDPEEFRIKVQTPSKCVGAFGFGTRKDAELQVCNTLKRYGPIDSVDFVKYSSTGKSKGYGFIFFRNLEDAKNAVEDANMKGVIVGNLRVRLDYSKSNPSAKIKVKKLPKGFSNDEEVSSSKRNARASHRDRSPDRRRGRSRRRARDDDDNASDGNRQRRGGREKGRNKRQRDDHTSARTILSSSNITPLLAPGPIPLTAPPLYYPSQSREYYPPPLTSPQSSPPSLQPPPLFASASESSYHSIRPESNGGAFLQQGIPHSHPYPEQYPSLGSNRAGQQPQVQMNSYTGLNHPPQNWSNNYQSYAPGQPDVPQHDFRQAPPESWAPQGNDPHPRESQQMPPPNNVYGQWPPSQQPALYQNAAPHQYTGPQIARPEDQRYNSEQHYSSKPGVYQYSPSPQPGSYAGAPQNSYAYDGSRNVSYPTAAVQGQQGQHGQHGQPPAYSYYPASVYPQPNSSAAYPQPNSNASYPQPNSNPSYPQPNSNVSYTQQSGQRPFPDDHRYG